MAKAKKRTIGFIGLIIVAIFTIFAAFIPNPAATATTTSNVNDSINVRVTSNSPNINITSPTNDTVFTTPHQTIEYDYDHIATAGYTLVYTDESGTTTTFDLGTITPSTTPSGSESFNLDLSVYGYGDFVFKVKGSNASGVSDEDAVAFSYYPVTGTAKQDNNGNVEINLNYNENNPEIDHVKINVYNSNGELITSLSPAIVPSPGKTTVIPFAEHNLPEGNYTFEFIAFNSAGTQISLSYKSSLYYSVDSPEDPSVVVPNTGGFLGISGISKTDSLAASLLVFFVVSLLGIFFIVRNHPKPEKAK